MLVADPCPCAGDNAVEDVTRLAMALVIPIPAFVLLVRVRGVK